jgi:hypothetical protein
MLLLAPLVTPCLLWTGPTMTSGYPAVTDPAVPGGQIGGHRLIAMASGPMPEGWVASHRCHNRRCVSPDHIRPATYAENQAKMARLGRATGPGPRVRPVEVEEMIRLRAEGLTLQAIGVRLGRATETIMRHMPPELRRRGCRG